MSAVFCAPKIASFLYERNYNYTACQPEFPLEHIRSAAMN